ncbi:MAG: hypothetical protein DLD55_03890 [candidate division SR1 bacterium]|nr:MAG: hypothetical protein DLD55_03890 [candidate division SR1 bacterium]
MTASFFPQSDFGKSLGVKLFTGVLSVSLDCCGAFCSTFCLGYRFCGGVGAGVVLGFQTKAQARAILANSFSSDLKSVHLIVSGPLFNPDISYTIRK